MARGIRTRDRQRDPALIPADLASSPVVRAQLERLWEVVHSEAGDRMVASLRRFSAIPEATRLRIADTMSRLPVTQYPTGASRLEVARWLLAHALRRGLALPKLQHADLFAAIAELIGNHEDIAAAMDRARDQRGPMTKTPSRRLDQRKVMTRLSRLNARRRKAGYPNM